jgi:hypothetical protein
MLGRIGMNVNLVSQTRSLHFPLIERWETDFYLLGWGVPTFDSQYVFDFLVHTRAKRAMAASTARAIPTRNWTPRSNRWPP